MALTYQQKNIIKVIIFVILSIVILALFRKKPPQTANLEMWGIYDDPQVWNSIIYDFQKQYPYINIKYTLKDEENYHEELLQAFAEGKGPDIFMVLGDWLPKYHSKIQPLDLKKDKEINLKYLQDNYPEVVLTELVKENQLLGIPLSVDTLALYYNRDIFNHFNIALPPKTWEEIISLVPILRQLGQEGSLKRTAIALGTSNNVKWASDILTALMMQYGSNIVDKSYLSFNFHLERDWLNFKIKPGIEALKFYTQFADYKNKNYTWNEGFDNSILSFSQAKTAMVIGYQKDYNYIKSKNPQLNFSVAPFPNFQNNPLSINYASTINLVVNSKIAPQKQKASWTFLKYLTQTAPLDNYYLLTNHPPSRRDLIYKYLNDPINGAFVSQILSSRSFYQFDSEVIKNIFSEMITKANRKVDYKEAVESAIQKLNFSWSEQIKKQS